MSDDKWIDEGAEFLAEGLSKKIAAEIKHYMQEWPPHLRPDVIIYEFEDGGMTLFEGPGWNSENPKTLHIFWRKTYAGE